MSIRVATAAAAAAVTTAAFAAAATAAGAHMRNAPRSSPVTARWTAGGSAQLLTPSASSPTTSPSAVLSLQKRPCGEGGEKRRTRRGFKRLTTADESNTLTGNQQSSDGGGGPVTVGDC